MNGPTTVLLLDDDPAFGDLLRPALGPSVVLLQAARASDVEDVLGGATADLYVVDGLLPDGTGIAWLRQFRRRDPRTPVAFVSAYLTDLGALERLRNDLGVSLVASKPVAPAVFASQLRALLPASDGRGAHAAVPQLDELRRRYAAGLPEAVAALARAVRGGGGTDARLLAHRLHGTAGTYGFAEVAEHARRLDGTLARRGAGAPESTAIDASLAALERAATAAARPAPEAPLAAVEVGRMLCVGFAPDHAARVLTVAHGAGLTAEIAPDVPTAARMARASPPDVGVLFAAPGASGPALAFATALRESGTEVILVGGDDSLEARVAAMHAGVTSVLRPSADADAIVTAARQRVAAGEAERPTVLVVDDDAAFAAHVCATLRLAGLRATSLSSPRKLLETLHEVRPDALLLDVVMPGFGGLDLCRMLRGIPEWQDLPILLVTAHTDAATRLAGYQAGADDHIPKPVLDRELVARIAVRVERRRLLRDRSDRDALTGVATRRAFLEALEARLSEAQRRGRPLSVAVLDVDHFKQVNDEHGHLVGDRVLAALGGLLLRRMRREDLRGRWGGEEFALALSEAGGPVAGGVVEQLLRELAALRFEGAGGEAFGVTFSAGVATFPADGDSVRALFDAADRRCYQAKHAGRARVVAGQG